METIGIAGIKTDCIYFKGDLPCAPHKKSGVHCPDCPSYQAIETRILIIKLGAIGDVIRTTPLLRKIRKEYPNCKITWLTQTPSILPAEVINNTAPKKSKGAWVLPVLILVGGMVALYKISRYMQAEADKSKNNKK